MELTEAPPGQDVATLPEAVAAALPEAMVSRLAANVELAHQLALAEKENHELHGAVAAPAAGVAGSGAGVVRGHTAVVAVSPAEMPPSCRNGSCRWAPSELDDLFGHDQVGHKTRNLLMRAGLTTPGAVAAASDAELLALANFGAACLARVRERFPAPVEAVAS